MSNENCTCSGHKSIGMEHKIGCPENSKFRGSIHFRRFVESGYPELLQENVATTDDPKKVTCGVCREELNAFNVSRVDKPKPVESPVEKEIRWLLEAQLYIARRLEELGHTD
jgi:hypothetical protein